MSAPTRCASCGSGAEADSKFCWLCGYPLGKAATLAPPSETVAAPPLDGFVWMGGFILALLVMLGVAVELALLWPGLLIPYAVVLVPVVAVMARIMYVQRFDFWKERREAPRTAAPAASHGAAGVDTSKRGDGSSGMASDVMGEVATAIAIGLGAVMVVVGLLILLSIAAFIILLAICLGMMAAYQ